MATRKPGRKASAARKREPALARSGADAALRRELAEARAQQAATAEILKVISRSADDAQPVFDAIVRSAMRLVGGNSCSVTRLADGHLHLVAFNSMGKENDEAFRALYPEPIDRRQVVREVIRTGRPQIIADVPSKLHQARNRAAPGAVSARKIGSLLLVPLLLERQTIGLIHVAREETTGFDPSQVSLIQTFADQAVIAIENVRLFNETKEALERQTATSEILNVISSSPTDVQPVFEAIVRTGVRLFKDAAVAVVRPDGGQVRLMAIAESDPGRAAKWADRFPFPLDREYIQSAAILDCAMVEVVDALAPQERFVEGRRNFALSGYRAMTVAPMLRDGAAIGAISVVRLAPGPLSERQNALLRTFAEQAVIAIENVRLFNETRRLEEERVSRLKSFFSPQLADMIATGRADELLKTHRREITVQFFDLRGFTAFTGAAEPEEVMELLRDFHGALGKLVLEHEGTIERFAGDSVMVFFNDPLPVERPAERAMRSALAMMRAFGPIVALWQKRGHDLGLGVGIAQGYATLGAIGFEGRRDYAAIGPVTNLAARLCAEAKAGQILVDRKTAAALEGAFEFDAAGPYHLKGFAQPVPAFALRA